jgi:hypothetical protein
MRIMITKFNSKPDKYFQFIKGTETIKHSIWIQFWWFTKTVQIAIYLW